MTPGSADRRSSAFVPLPRGDALAAAELRAAARRRSALDRPAGHASGSWSRSGTARRGSATGPARRASAIDDPEVAPSVDATASSRPLGNGLATLTATVGNGDGRGATISVEDFDVDDALELPQPRRAGADQAGLQRGGLPRRGGRQERIAADACAATAPRSDYDVLTRQALGRRIVKTAPAESLLLLKPTGALEHGGGVRFAPDSLEYRVIAEWIAAGMPAPVGDRCAEFARSTVYPRRRPARARQTQQVLVQAAYSDGRVEDVTRWAKFASTDETVARVDEIGRRRRSTGRGEAAITVWFASLGRPRRR